VIDLDAVLPALRDPLAFVRKSFLLGPKGVPRPANEVADLLGPLLADRFIQAGMSACYGILPAFRTLLANDTGDEIWANRSE
jgi:hypothetical protein